MNMPKLILLDLDFTLLKSDRTISEHTLKVLKDYQSKGIKIGFSTSRGNTNIPQVKEIADEITLTNDEDGVAVYLESCQKLNS